MDFEIPPEIQSTLDALDEFIEREIKPLEQADDNVRFFDHRREYARTDFEQRRRPAARLGGAARARCAAAPTPPAGCATRSRRSTAVTTPSNLEMAIIREHLATKGLGLHNDLQNESSIVGNFPTVLMMRDFGTDEQRAEWMPGFLDGTRRLAFGLTEPNHGSDATYLETTASPDGDEWVHQRHEAVQLRAAPRDARHRVRAHVGRTRLAGRHHRVPRADRRRRASASTSSGGRSTCRPTTPR